MKPNHALNDLLRVAKMPRSSFYYKEIKRDYHEAKEAILSLYKKNRKRDGYRPMTFKLRQRGFHLNHKTVLEQGLSRLKPTECPIIHSDQGVLYGSAEWVKMLEGKAVQSMSRRGNCYDNAVIESFFAILKSECFYSRTYHSIAELQAEIEEYLVYYNQKRIKLGLKGLSPVQYRAQYLS